MMEVFERHLPRLVCVVSLAVLWWNAAPSVTFHDSGEMALAAASAGIPHPPGMPTWTALASTFVRIGGFEDAARGSNLFSGLCAAGALGILSLLVLTWTARIWPESSPGARVAGALAAPLVLLRSPAFLEQSFITEQYTLMVFLLALMLWVGSVLVSPGVGRAGALLFVLGALWSLAIGNHLSQIALGAFVVWVIGAHAGWLGNRRALARAGALTGLGFVCGLALFLWLPIRSAQNPVMDWGHIRSWDGFVFALTRGQWPTRAISSAPRGYIGEWLSTYEFIRQSGLVGMVFGAGGIALLARRGRMLLGWLMVIILPYAAGIMLAHMREDGKDIGYLRHYGVTDWHLPIYFAVAAAAGVGLAAACGRLARMTPGAPLVVTVLIMALGIDAAGSIRRESLRGFTAPERFIRDIQAAAPDDAVLAFIGDNAAYMSAYDRHGRGNNPGRHVIIALRPLPRLLDELAARGEPWNEERKVRYLTEVVMEPRYQPIRTAPPEADRARTARVFVDYVGGYPGAFPWLVPAGLVFEARLTRATPEEIRNIEAENQKRHPELFRAPEGEPHRLEAEAHATLHLDRGMYFGQLGLWPEAEAAMLLSLQWIGENGAVWYQLGMAQERLGKAREAEASYENAIAFARLMPGPRNILGILHATRGELDRAIELFGEEARLFPESDSARENLERARAERRMLEEEAPDGR